MAVLIKGMEMPKHDDEYVIFTVYGDGGVVYGPLNRPHVRYKNRAVPVPPHGLIDREQILDAIRLELAQANAVNDMEDYDSWMRVFDYVRKFPTVIPASEEGET